MLYFIAILTPDNINQQILEWKHYMLQQFHCKVALKSPAHITLIPPFDMPDALHPDLQELLQHFSARQTDFSIQLNNFDAFAKRVIFVNVVSGARLNALQTNLEIILLQSKRFPINKEDRPFHPHVTIANRDLKKEDFPLAWQYFQQWTYEETFMAGAISLLQHNGNTWQIAGSYPLEGKR